MGRQLFLIDPIGRLRPEKDSSVALMQAGQRAGEEIWAAQPSDLAAGEGGPRVLAAPITAEPWYSAGEARWQPLSQFQQVWMRKDPPVDEAYLYATHLLELAERQGVQVLNRPASLRAWNEKLGALQFPELMAPTLVASDVELLRQFAATHGEVVLKPLGGRAGQGVIRSSGEAPGLGALLELVTQQQQLPVMIQAFLPQVSEGDKRILLVNGEPLGAVNRKPKAGEFRSNLAVGGQPEATDLSPRERQICDVLRPALIEAGLFFVGIDVIAGHLSEINVTSPTGIREVEQLGKIPLADLTQQRLLQG
ncbi:glutathione synthetase [Synechococcus sp. Minos11]|uniref:glutathione synthase n=1 Tax=Synechococcus sp. Minos11 TaxID=221341 RepID=UPI00015260E5|nr:glutathione synthase [Synechococcus sp. Minos11]MEC8607024.1 glutathione synthase [Cyanobacteriota bacterium]RCL63972.1 MAG: glutathione synthase [Synechococcus sp. MED-G67]CAK29154.1 Glutathione synthetase [Synechococcus sp. RCC307]HCA62145.1 glutathione synthase [Synechococcales bacterium UBA8647]HCV56039.1 glutathione synthase [Synechococcales bacterium UBA12195]